MKDKWRYYGTETRLIKKGYIPKHKDRDGRRQAAEAIRSDCLVESRKIQEEKITQSVGDEIIAQAVGDEIRRRQDNLIREMLESSASTLDSTLKETYEEIREEDIAQTHQQRQQRVQSPVKRRRKAEKADHEIRQEEVITDCLIQPAFSSFSCDDDGDDGVLVVSEEDLAPAKSVRRRKKQPDPSDQPGRQSGSSTRKRATV